MAGRMKTPYPEIVWTKGPSLLPKDALVAWLDSLGPKPLVRMPVTIHFRPDGLGIDRGTAGELDLRLDDTGLGVSLMDHARRASPERTSAPLHLEGHWHGMKDGRGVFLLYRVHREVAAGVDYAETAPTPER